MLSAVVAGVAEYTMTDGNSGWVPLGAGVAGAVVTLIFAVLKVKVRAEEPPQEPSERLDLPQPSEAQVRYTIAAIIESVKGMTDVERKARLPLYVGEVVEEEGTVSNVAEHGGRYLLGVEVGQHYVQAWSSSKEVAALRQGEHVQLRARVVTVDRTSVEVEGLELIRVGGPIVGELGAEQDLPRHSSDSETANRLESETRRGSPEPANVALCSVEEVVSAARGLTDLERKDRIDALYKGKPLEFRGSVRNVEEFDGSYYLTLYEGEWAVNAEFAEAAPVRHLKVGDTVSLRGEVRSAGDTIVFLANPEILKLDQGLEI